MNKKGIIRDLVLVSVAALIAVLAVQFTGPKQTDSQSQTEDLAVDTQKKTPVTGDSINDQIIALRVEMAQAHAVLDKKISELAYSGQGVQDDSKNIESMVEQFTQQPSFEDKVVKLVDTQVYDQEASDQFLARADQHLDQLVLNGSRINSANCYANKCVAVFEHSTADDENLFMDNVLFDSKGLFTGRFSYNTESGEDGKVYTKVILNR